MLGLSITSSWGNGHATTYRGLLKALAARGHHVTFLERDVPWYAANRDLTAIPGVRTALYGSVEELQRRYGSLVRQADVAILGSYVPDGVAVGEWLLRTARGVTAFYDIDTPVTLGRVWRDGRCDYLTRGQIERYDLYLSFAGGRALERLERLGARLPRPLFCCVDPDAHRPAASPVRWNAGYLGTYASDRQPALKALLLDVARSRPAHRFVVGGPQYPPEIDWPPNVDRLEHVAPDAHARFYAAQRFTLNLTRADMRALGHAPSVRLFEAAACGAAIVSDVWAGLEELFVPNEEILLASTAHDVERYLHDLPEAKRCAIARAGRTRVLAAHTAAHRAAELEAYVTEAMTGRSSTPDVPARSASA